MSISYFKNPQEYSASKNFFHLFHLYTRTVISVIIPYSFWKNSIYFIKKACYPITILNLKSYGGKIYFETENKWSTI